MHERGCMKTYGKCFMCQIIKVEQIKTLGSIQPPLGVPNNKWESINMDFTMGLPRNSKGHDSIFVVVDQLTKHAHFITTKSTMSTIDVGKTIFS